VSSVLYTIGHSNHAQELLLAALVSNHIEVLCDVRRYPRSRRNPQFNSDRLALALAEHGIEYRHLEALGGRREPHDGSPNTALRDPGIRGFADYMLTSEFETAIEAQLQTAVLHRTAVMCAESLPSHCHRSLIADVVVARGGSVLHIVGSTTREHEVSPLATVLDGRVTYPAMI